MAPGQDTKGGNFGMSFDLMFNNGMLSVLIRIASKLF